MTGAQIQLRIVSDPTLRDPGCGGFITPADLWLAQITEPGDDVGALLAQKWRRPVPVQTFS